MNRKNEAEQAEIIRQDDNKVVLKLDDGTEKTVTESTLKRWWKKTEVEIQEEVKETKTKGNRKPREMKPEIKELMEYVYTVAEAMGAEIWEPAKDIKMKSIKVGGHMAVKVNYSNRMLTLNCRSKVVANIDNPDVINNHCFDYGYQFMENTKQDRQLIESLINASVLYVKDKYNKEEKEEDKEVA